MKLRCKKDFIVNRTTMFRQWEEYEFVKDTSIRNYPWRCLNNHQGGEHFLSEEQMQRYFFTEGSEEQT